MAQAAIRVTSPPPILSLAPLPMFEFVLRVAGDYAVIIEAPNIEDAQALALADEYPCRARASLQEVGDQDDQLDFEVGL